MSDMSSGSQLKELALFGGEAMLPEGPPSWPLADESVHRALESAFADGSWGRYHGPHVEHLESCLAEYHAVPHALTCCSGTFAVELALRALKVKAGDEVILAGYDFSGNFRSIEATGARPVLVDIDPLTSSLDVALVEQAIGASTRAIVASHLHGGIVTMSALREIADRRGLQIVEDACQTPGGRVEARRAGAWGDVGVLSFGGSKLLTAGRGGAIVTTRQDIAQRAKSYCEQGNNAFPLSELQAAVLLPQLEELDGRNAIRWDNAELLREQLRDINGLTPVAEKPPESSASLFKMAWLFDKSTWTVDRDRFLAAMQAEGVAVDAGFRGFTKRGSGRCRRVGHLTNSEQAAHETVLLHHPVLLESRSTIEKVVAAFHKVHQAFSEPNAA
ncbi:MAG: DegT/DnrJ/EryC1/StrS family aminotransferase [Planctomycetaceae bacterium]|nr:DegT/DnrJ/EryC1/StrS family aminotransferase [Planctomycetales bacterium]MCB9875076.1 DegT/DnrJ/EryC1/StrS family aminotransferase [Planctomycetaceae bacterium]MCB9941055.1 DegT/DnrJ/EryC1/StrS family aminotransferase [Planctomycetaceae bacterium]